MPEKKRKPGPIGFGASKRVQVPVNDEMMSAIDRATRQNGETRAGWVRRLVLGELKSMSLWPPQG